MEIGTFLKHPTLGLCRVIGNGGDKVRIVQENGEESLLVGSFVQKRCALVAAGDIDPRSPLLVKLS